MVRSSWCFGLGLLLLVGCGDDAQPGCDTGEPCVVGTSSGGADGSGDGASATAGMTSTSATVSATGDGTSDSSADTSAGSTTDGGAASTGADGSSTGQATGDGTTTGGQGNVEYTAVALPGGLDRIRVFKHDLADDRCTWMVLVFPGFGSKYAVTTPMDWSVESIQASDVGAACGSDNPAMFGSEPATAASGTVAFGALGVSGVYPCTITLDVSADFAGLLPGVPPTDVLVATDVAVDGC